MSHPPPPVPTPSKCPEIKRQLREFRAQQAFERHLARLREELRAGTPRERLDVLVELLDGLLPDCGRTRLTECYREELAALRREVVQRSNERRAAQPTRLRLVK